MGNDESLWEIIHLTGDVPAELLKQIIDRGCKYMALGECHVKRADVRFENNFKLKYLSLEDCVEDPDENFDILPNLAASCHKLEKFSVNQSDNPWISFSMHGDIHPNIFQCIMQNSGTLRVLSLNDTKLDLVSVQHIFTHCSELIELSIESGLWCEESINFMCENLTNKIEKLDLSWQESFKDEHLKKFVDQMQQIDRIWIFRNTFDHFDAIIENLSETLVKMEPLKMSFPQLLRLASMPNLKVLCSAHGNITKESEKRIKKAMPHLKISHGPLKVASPYAYQLSDSPVYPSGFWEIKAKAKWVHLGK